MTISCDMMGAPTNEELGTSDEIKEFKHEGEETSAKEAHSLIEMKSALGQAADRPPLPAALNIKNTKLVLSPVVAEVANRIKQEHLNAQQELYRSQIPPMYGQKLQDYPAICLPGPVPNVNASSLSSSLATSSYLQPTWSTPVIITSTQSTLQQRTHPGAVPRYPHYLYQQPMFHYQHPTAFVQNANQQPPAQPTPSPQSATTKGGKAAKKKVPHIKKPLNAFMLYMKEMRAKVVQEYTLKESAAINQILGKRWHALDRSEQARFYEMARRERALHMQMYPNWSARSGYAANNKRKRKRDKNADPEAGSPKKCRARYGLDKQSSWCKPCRRKKKCVRYLHGEDVDCKDGKCDADGENHKPSCPAAHEPGCAARGKDSPTCDCNTHTCGAANKKDVKKDVKKEGDKPCTCKKEEEEKEGAEKKDKTDRPPNVVIKSDQQKDTLHLASVANLSLTRESAPIVASSYEVFAHHRLPHNTPPHYSFSQQNFAQSPQRPPFTPRLMSPQRQEMPSVTPMSQQVARSEPGGGVQVGYIPSPQQSRNVLSHLPIPYSHQQPR